ncbi:AAA family ATPase [Streptomyces sp. NPDC052023]|uniref:AAA family ATPase n=1 Tax=Streptomyces sp. NPDC052023 TaxID=3365681 RepID=UPI0037D19997
MSYPDPKGSRRYPLAAERLGRHLQWTALREAIASVRDEGRALLLCGEAGIGKTVLLEQAGQFAADRGLRLLRAAGAESEKDLPFAVLHQLLWTLRDETRQLTPAGRTALERALGISADGAAGSYTVSAAALELLDAASRRRPLALLVDDLHWTDTSSAEVLHFVRRRLAGLPVVLVGTVREEALPALDASGGRVLDLTPLTDAHAEGLLRELHPDLSDPALRRIVREAAGNPLALVELPGRLGAPHRTGSLPLPDRLPLGERLEGMFARRVAALAPSVRFTLLLCALAGHDGQSLHLVAAAARAAGADAVAEDLAGAERGGLVHIDEPTALVRFRHPLVRSSLAGGATGAERRRAHAAWARVLPSGGLRQVTHLAAATAVPDEAVARALDEAARLTACRGGDAEAARLLARAAALSGDAEGRGRRLTAAASAALRGGRIDMASRLLGQAVAGGVPEDSRDTLDFTRAQVRMQRDGDFGPAVSLLPRILDGVTGPLRLQCLFLLYLCAGYTADPQVWQAARARLGGAPDLAWLGHDVWHDPARRAQGGRERLEAALGAFSGADEGDTAQVWLLLWAAVGLDAVGDRSALWERLAHRHSYTTQALIASVSAYDDYLHGHWDRCVERARAGADEARARGFLFNERTFRYKEGYVTAARGQRQAVEDLVAVLGPWAAAHGLTFVTHRLRAMQALCALALGDAGTAYAHASSLTPPGTLPADVAQFHLVFLDLVEAAVRSGRTEEARRHVAAGRAARMDLISPHHEFVLLAAQALVSDDADTACAAVYGCAHAGDWPFELARVRFHHGAWLRRRGRRAQARERLAAARDAFAGLGAGPWRDRAEEELRVCDEARAADAVDRLTPQELRIAALVAEGLTNRDIGTRLQLSPKTVASHLYRLYPKLGVTTRAAVARALNGRAEQ